MLDAIEKFIFSPLCILGAVIHRPPCPDIPSVDWIFIKNFGIISIEKEKGGKIVERL